MTSACQSIQLVIFQLQYIVESKGTKESLGAEGTTKLPSDLSLEMKGHGFAATQRTAAAGESFEPIFSPDTFKQLVHEMLDAKMRLS